MRIKTLNKWPIVFVLFSTIWLESPVFAAGSKGSGTVAAEQCAVFTQAPNPEEPLEIYQRIVRESVASGAPIAWRSSFFSSAQPCSEERALAIINLVANPSPALKSELDDAIFKKLAGGLQSAEMWNKYFRSYDKVVLNIPAYREIFIKASSLLPATGRIADLGSGTGNGALLLKVLEPQRDVVGYEFAETGRAMSEVKFSLLPNALRPLNKQSFFGVDLTHLNEVGTMDGAVMNNVLYAIADKANIFRRVFRAMRPGALLVMNDPPLRSGDPAENLKFQTTVIQQAIHNGSSLSEFDVAIVASMNLTRLMPLATLVSPEEIKAEAEAAGFEAITAHSTYLGSGSTFAFKRP